MSGIAERGAPSGRAAAKGCLPPATGGRCTTEVTRSGRVKVEGVSKAGCKNMSSIPSYYRLQTISA
jgi:hypothetical protein